MRQGSAFFLGIVRALLGLYQTFVLIAVMCNLGAGDGQAAFSGFVWFLILCVVQLAILGIAFLIGGSNAPE